MLKSLSSDVIHWDKMDRNNQFDVIGAYVQRGT
jgi:hypothetical protein